MQSIYVHIPFCKSRCRYCDFFSTTQLDRRKEYVDAVLAEWASYPHHTPNTLYLGGGTPSMLDVEDIKRIIDAIATKDTTEITMEANPGDLTLDKLVALRQAGVNRLSIGVQTFRTPLLRLIGRRHTGREARQAIRWAQKAGFNNISIDLMYALPRQTMVQWSMDVRKAVRMGVQHISCYCLTYEEGTPMCESLKKGEFRAATERLQNRMYQFLCKVLKRQGYEHYEVSNFALPGYRSRHNSNYWNDTPYIGLGAGAHSYDGNKRWWNPCDLDIYMQGIKNNNLQRETEELTDEQHHIERVMLGLRTIEGIEEQEVSYAAAKVNDYISRGLLMRQGSRLVATQEGLNILNRIIEDLL